MRSSLDRGRVFVSKTCRKISAQSNLGREAAKNEPFRQTQTQTHRLPGRLEQQLGNEHEPVSSRSPGEVGQRSFHFIHFCLPTNRLNANTAEHAPSIRINEDSQLIGQSSSSKSLCFCGWGAETPPGLFALGWIRGYLGLLSVMGGFL